MLSDGWAFASRPLDRLLDQFGATPELQLPFQALAIRFDGFDAQIPHVEGVLQNQAVDFPGVQRPNQLGRTIKTDESDLPGQLAILESAEHAKVRVLIMIDQIVGLHIYLFPFFNLLVEANVLVM